MENTKQTLKIMGIGQNVNATLTTEWNVPGSWFECGRLVSGVIGKKSHKSMEFFSVIDAQNFANEIGAEFVGLQGIPCGNMREFDKL